MSARHTPGPWPDPEYDNDDCSGGYWYDIPGVCRAIYKKEDAILIAAAPDLLSALQAFVATWGDYPFAGIEQARAAIAKATGSAS